MTIFLHAIGWASLTFSIIGLIELVLGLIKTGTYNLLRAVIYSGLFGLGLALLR
jgi:hypothetical protein